MQYQKDTLIRFRAFPDFWGIKEGSDRAPKVDTLIFSITPDASARFARLRANECQVVRYPVSGRTPPPCGPFRSFPSKTRRSPR